MASGETLEPKNIFWILLLTIEVKDSLERASNIFDAHFRDVVGRNDFIDKTLFIRDMFNIEGNCHLSMPANLGKTTLLDMTRTFLEIETDSKGNALTAFDWLEKPINDTGNYEFFLEHNFEILTVEEIMREHFGRHPVISASFKVLGNMTTFRNFLGKCRQAIHESYKEHEYLKNSKSLYPEERKLVRKWCDDYRTTNTTEIKFAIRNLTQLTCMHFNGRKSFVLIDEDDYLVQEAFENMADKLEAEEALEFMGEIIKWVVKENKYLEQAFVTGKHCCFEKTDFKRYKHAEAMRFERIFEKLFNWRPMTITLNYIG